MPKYYVYPAIGIARVGNSESKFFVGPEVPHQEVNPNYTGDNFGSCYEAGSLQNLPGSSLDFKDAEGKVKRQAARFRIFEVSDCGNNVREITDKDAKIEWRVNLANRKSINYQFENAMDLGKLSKDCKLRNDFITNLDERKKKLLIKPSQCKIQGCNQSDKPAYQFNDGTFFAGTSYETQVYLGELRTDSEGRLLVLGGLGHSASYNNSPITTFANNETWHDDISDGTVRATVTIDNKPIEAEPAMVAVTPPNFAPGMPGVITMYDVVSDLLLDANTKTEFYRDIYPILSSLVENQGVNEGYFMAFGDYSPANFTQPDILEKLESNSEQYKSFRTAVFDLFRVTPDITATRRAEKVELLLQDPAVQDVNKQVLEPIFDEAVKQTQTAVQADKLPPIFGDGYGDYADSPLIGLSLTNTQYKHLKNWADGKFEKGENPREATINSSCTITDPLQVINDQNNWPHTLTKTNLQQCLGGPFHPGIELTWFLRRKSMWNTADPFDPMRLNIVECDDDVQDYYGPILTPEVALKDMFNVSGPGTLTRFMGVPWQSDEGSCQSNESYDPAQYLPTMTFWSARVPNQVLSQRSFEQLQNEAIGLGQRAKSYSYRQDWLRFLREGGEKARVNMVKYWDKIGIVVKTPTTALKADHNNVDHIWVESQVNERFLANDTSYRQLLNLENLAHFEGNDLMLGENAVTNEQLDLLDKEDEQACEQGLTRRKITIRQDQN
ncbi:LodA/GoxA family CTQ-dependent oxidase [Pseudoalteromonas luteoviolacea]|uniref:LodA/GoxA family CTQ-dependent oxidase n=1 Tax=Pseudoalteromonas luteoviolacea TaxID=43657 RepID=UPI00068CCE25|nr:LodA/GoxA family CTQ-dependent oxidase [Pseudoalteromonas luteoviolacea]